MSTGVDAQTCKLIVLDQHIKSMTLFKQIIGRGTRLREDLGKSWFTILDFKRATELFADPTFDGDPVQVYEPKAGDPIEPPVPSDNGFDRATEAGPDMGDAAPDATGSGDGGTDKPRRYVVGGTVNVAVARERVQYLNAEGKLVTESLRDFTRKALHRHFSSLDDFLKRWSAAERKQALVDELAAEGLPLEVIAAELGKDLDPFDLVCHIAFDAKPLTRRERAENVKKRDVFAQYGPQARAVLDALLDKYADEGVLNLDDAKVLRIPPLDRLGTPVQLVNAFGGKAGFEQAVHALQSALYQETA
jgi:type I restriction enzyme R subunit